MRPLRRLPQGFCCRLIITCVITHLIVSNITPRAAKAGPVGAQVVNGDVSIRQSGYNTTVTASDKAIINYNSFDVARPETVQFVQPSSSASVLNRILSTNPTNINGTVLANGRVFFVNPAGVYFGEGARVNVNQLVASALNISDFDFINGNYIFAGGNGSVLNSGVISAEQVHLIGKQVTNSGSINCPAGYVLMAAGDRVFLGEPDSEIVLEVDSASLPESADAAGRPAAVLNEGRVEAAGGIIALAAAGDIYSQGISNVGSISTSTEAGRAGQIELAAAGADVINTGTIEASGAEGGQVVMEGARVGQFGTIRADGTTGDGGNVRLTARDVVAVSSDSLTTVNAGLNGNGGEVIAYSPDTALFRSGAKIEAKGGAESGDGGFVEVSGKEHVEVFGTVEASAANGMGGLFFIDPYNITVQAAVGTLDGLTPNFVANAADSTVGEAVIETQLNSGTSVLIRTADGVSEPTQTGLITQNVQIDKSAGGDATITYDAAGDIILNSGISSTVGQLNVAMQANSTTGGTATGTGSIVLGAAISTNGGNFTCSGVDFDNTGGAITTAGGNVDIQNSGNVTIGAAINAGAGDIIIDGGTGAATSISGSGTITSSGTITFEASGSIGAAVPAINTAGTGAISAISTDGDIYIDNAGNVTDLRLNADSGMIAFTNTDSVDTGAPITANTISLASTGTMTIDQAVTADSGTLTLSGALVNIDQNINAAGNIDLDASGNLDLGADIASSGGDVDIDVAGTVDVAAGGRITAGGDGTALTINGNGITLNTGVVGAETVANTGTGTLTITDSGNTSLQNNSISIGSGTLTIDSANIAGPGNSTEIYADGDVSLTGAQIGGIIGNAAIDIDSAGTPGGDSTLTVNSDGAGDIGLDINADLFDVLNITIADATASTIAIDWAADNIDMATNGSALTLTDIDTSGFAPDVIITQSVGDVLVSTVNTGSGSFTLESTTGSIEEVAPGDTDIDITASTASLNAAAGIGAIAPLELAVAGLSAATANGSIQLSNTNPSDVELTNISTGGAGANITFDQVGGGALTLTSVSTADGTVDISADSGNIIATSVTAGTGGDILLDTTTSGDIMLGSLTAADDRITINSAGAVNDATTDTIIDLTASELDLDAVTGIGAVAAIETVAMTIDADTTGAAAHIDIDNVSGSAAQLTSVSTAGAGANITFDQTGGGAITLTSVTTTDGTIDISADSGSILATLVTAGTGGDISLNTTIFGDITLGSLTADSDRITINSAGAIDDAAADALADLSADEIDLDAVTGIGAVAPIETVATTIDADTTGAAAHIDIDNAGGPATELTSISTTGDGANITFDQGGGALTLTSVTTAHGTIDINADSGNIIATSVIAGSTGDILLDTTSFGDITLGSLRADGDRITINSTGAVDDAAADAVADLIAAELDLDAVTGIGAVSAIETIATTIDADTTGDAAHIDIDNATSSATGLTSVSTAGAGANITFDQAGGGALTLTSATTADGTIDISVDSANIMATLVAAGASGDISLDTTKSGNIAIGSLTAGDDISLESAGAITQGAGGISAQGGSLAMKSEADLNMINYDVVNQAGTDLTLISTGGSVTSTAADNWQRVTASALGNITLSGTSATREITAGVLTSSAGNICVRSTNGNLHMTGGVNAALGGVSLIADNGRIYTSGDMLNIPITGYSDTAGTGVSLLIPGDGRGAIVIMSAEDLTLGPGAVLTANGIYDPVAVGDDRSDVDFATGAADLGDDIDVAIYLRSYRSGGSPAGSLLVDCGVLIQDSAVVVLDAGAIVEFGREFKRSIFDPTNRLEIVSRRSTTLNEVISYNRLPYADYPENIRSAFGANEGVFTGAYVLRGVRTLLAEILGLINPVPLATPRPFTVEVDGEVEEPDTNALADLLSELGIGVQPYVTEAYAASLSTDLRLYSAAEKLQKLIPILEDADGIHVPALRAAAAQFFPTLDVISEEQMDSFLLELASHTGDGTDFDLAARCIAALAEYVTILSNDIGWPADKSIEFVMGRYVPRLTEGDEIRLAIIQIQLQKASGV